MINPGNTAPNRYGSIAAEIYDLDKPVGGLPDTAFHLSRLAGLAGESLEPACGSGRALPPLPRAGCHVAGFDASEDMLGRCRARCADIGASPDLSVRRLEDFHYDRRFAAIVLPVNSFTLVDDVEVALSVLRRFWDHLETGGRLILDLPRRPAHSPRRAGRHRLIAQSAQESRHLYIGGHWRLTIIIAPRANHPMRQEGRTGLGCMSRVPVSK